MQTNCINLKRIMLSEKIKSITQSYILNGSIDVIFLKWQYYKSGTRRSGFQGIKCGGGRREIWETFVVIEMFHILTISVWIDQWLWHCCDIVLQDVTVGGNWVKSTQDLYYNCIRIYNYLRIKGLIWKICRPLHLLDKS